MLPGTQTEMYRSSAGTVEAAFFVHNLLFITENGKAHPSIGRQHLNIALQVNRSLYHFSGDFIYVLTFHLWAELHSSLCYCSNLSGGCLCQL